MDRNDITLYMLDNEDNCCVEYKGNIYTLDVNTNTLRKGINCLNNVKDIQIDDELKNHILYMCYDDLPF